MKLLSSSDTFISFKDGKITFTISTEGFLVLSEGGHYTEYNLILKNDKLSFVSFIEDKETEKFFKKAERALKGWKGYETLLKTLPKL